MRSTSLPIRAALAALVLATVLAAVPEIAVSSTRSPYLLHAYVANGAGNSVLDVNALNGKVLGTIPVGSDPVAIVFDETAQTAFVLDHGDGTVLPIDVATRTPGTPINVGSNPTSLATTIVAGKTRLWVGSCGTTPSVQSVDLTAGGPVLGPPIDIAGCPADLVLGTNALWASEPSLNAAQTILGSTVGPLERAPAPLGLTYTHLPGQRFPGAIAADSGGNTVAFLGTSKSVGRTAAQVTVGSNPTSVDSNASAKIVIANSGDGTIATRDRFGTLVTIPVGGNPDLVRFLPDGRRALVIDSKAGTLRLVSTTQQTVGLAIQLGFTPTALAIAPDQGAAARLSCPSTAKVGVPVTLDGSASTSTAYPITGYTFWPLGTAPGIPITTSTLVYTYTQAGTFTVHLEVTDGIKFYFNGHQYIGNYPGVIGFVSCTITVAA